MAMCRKRSAMIKAYHALCHGDEAEENIVIEAIEELHTELFKVEAQPHVGDMVYNERTGEGYGFIGPWSDEEWLVKTEDGYPRVFKKEYMKKYMTEQLDSAA